MNSFAKRKTLLSVRLRLRKEFFRRGGRCLQEGTLPRNKEVNDKDVVFALNRKSFFSRRSNCKRTKAFRKEALFRTGRLSLEKEVLIRKEGFSCMRKALQLLALFKD